MMTDVMDPATNVSLDNKLLTSEESKNPNALMERTSKDRQ